MNKNSNTLTEQTVGTDIMGNPLRRKEVSLLSLKSEKQLPLTAAVCLDLVKYPVITEKSYVALFKNSQYTFDVDLRLNKSQIKKLFENLFSVNVISVNTHIPPRKKFRAGSVNKGNSGYKPRYKRAIITLKKGESINYNIGGFVTS